MMATFNLIDEPFIPCVLRGGEAVEYGLRDVLMKAHEIVEIRDPSPLVTVALHRLLLAILHRVYRGPTSSAERLAIRNAGQFDAGRVGAYLAEWADRFDLFHEKYPFYQRAGFTQDEPSGINRLAQERSRGNNAALFDHTTDDPPLCLTPAQAARAVITEHAFTYSAGRGKKGEPHTLDGPNGRAVAVFALGDSLFETLWLNLTIYKGDDQPVACCEDDGPIWERDPLPPYGDSSIPRGYLDYLTWQSRTICLHPTDEEGRTVIRHVSYSQGRVWKQPDNFYDPCTAYERVPDVGDRAVQFRENKELWRDSAAFFQFADTDQFRGPTCLSTLGIMISHGDLPRSARCRLMVAGACVVSGKPTMIFWRHESLPLPLRYLDDRELVGSLQAALALAEAGATAIQSAAWATVANRLTSSPDLKPDTDRVRDLYDSFAPDRAYWSRLELPYRKLLLALAAEGADRTSLLARWYWDTLRPTAVAAFDNSVGRIDGGRDLKAVTAGRGVLFGRLKQIQKEHNIPELKKEGAA